MTTNIVEHNYRDEVSTALTAVATACKIAAEAREQFDEELDVTIKPDRSPVTVADYAVQAWINAAISKRFPADGIMGEEDNYIPYYFQNERFTGRIVDLVQQKDPQFSETEILKAIGLATSEGGRSGRFWCIDPIDGTRGFIRGGQYAIALSLIVDGEVKVGILGCPNLLYNPNSPNGYRGIIFSAIKGSGAYACGFDLSRMDEVSVDAITEISSAKLGTPFEMGRVPRETITRFAATIGIKEEPYRIDSQCKYAVLARGEVSIYLRLPSHKREHRGYIWDHSAGVLIVEEAGGTVTDLAGRKLDFGHGRLLESNRGILATNGKLHTKVLEHITASLPAELLEL